MPYIYARVKDLENKDMVGSTQCVALVQRLAGAPVTLAWKKGEDVLSAKSVTKGTAIATFVNGKYPNHRSGNHAALYLESGIDGFWIMDQWKGKENGKISSRFIKSLGRDKNGKFRRPSNNADAYSIIE